MNKMKKLLSSLLALSMVLSYVPMPAVAEEVCTHHAHDKACGYVEAVEGKSCTHQCTESCPKKDVTVCVHDHVKLGCAHTPAVEGVACDHVHGEACGYVPAQAAVPCTCGAVAAHTAQCASLLTEGADCDCGMPTLHAEGCEPKAAVAEQCSHVHGACAYKAAVQESWGCGHVCTKDSGCVKTVCAHAHDASCGYVQAVKGSDCTFVCTECKAEEKTCTCGAAEEGEDEHAPFCDLYVRTYEECKCVLDCAVEGRNDWCETCYFEGVEACGASGEEEDALFTVTEGDCGTGVRYAFDDVTGVLTISGSGAIAKMANATKYPWYKKRSSITKIVIESGVTTIPQYAFNTSSANSVIIPDTVTGIGKSAFYGNANLTSISIPSSVTTIGETAFKNCKNLETVYTNCDETAWNTKLGKNAFQGTLAADEGFNYSSPPATTNYTVTITVSGNGTVSGDGTYPKGDEVTVIATPDTNYKFVHWTENGTPVSTTKTYRFTLTGDRSLTAVFEEFTPNSGACGTDVYYTFDEATGVLTISGTGAMKDYLQGEAPWYDFRAQIKSVVIKNGITIVSQFGFHNCDALTSVTIPDSVTSFHTGTFSDCDALTSFTIPPQVKSMGQGVFTGCSSLTSVTISEGVETIPANTFSSTPLTSITIPASVKNIALNAFYHCEKLTTVNYLGLEDPVSINEPYNVEEAQNVFRDCNISGITVNVPVGYQSEYFCGLDVTKSGYNVSVTADPAEGGTVSGAGSYAENTSVTVTAEAASGYSFTGWKENGEVVSTDNPYTFTATANRNLTAVFEAHTHNWTYTAEGATITAACTAENCTNPNGGSVTISASNATYDGTAKAASLSADSIGGIGELSVVYEGLSSAPVNAGTYTASLTVDTDKTISVTYTIAQKELTIKADDQTIPYGGTLDNTKITNTGLIDGHSVTVTLIPSITAVGTGEITPSAAVIKAGDVDVTANYEITYENGALTITKASTSIAFNGYAPGKTYDGQPLANPTAEQLTITGASYSDVTFTWYAGSVAEKNKLTSAPSDTGTYYVVASIAETANTTASSATSEAITIDKLDISGAAITLGTALTYTGEEQTQTVSKVEKNGLVVTYTVEGDTGTEVKNDYILTVTGTSNFTGTATTTWSIGKAAPSYTVPTGLTATYGQTLANVTLPTGWVWKDASASVGNVGTNTFSAVFTPTDTANYSPAEEDLSITVSPKEVTITGITATNREYNGSNVVEVTGGIVNGVIGDDEVFITFVDAVATTENANAGNGKAVTMTGVDLDGAGASNYVLKEQPSGVTVNITKASVTAANTELIILNNLAKTYIVDLSQLLPAQTGTKTYGNVTYTMSGHNLGSYYNGGAQISDGVLSLPIRSFNSTEEGTFGSVTISFTTDNFTVSDATITVKRSNKTALTITGVTAAEGLTYNGAAQTGFTGTAAAEGYNGTIEVTYTGTGSTTYGPSATAPTNAGTYTVKFSIPGTDAQYRGEATLNFTITKAVLTITADDKTAVEGDTKPAFTYKVTGLVGEEKLTTEPTLTCNVDMSKSGEYAITPSSAQASNNYSITYVSGKLTVFAKYAVKVASTTNGTVTVSPEKAPAGTQVTITVTPKSGYKLSTLTVKDAAGNSYAVSTDNNGKYYFTMPAAEVTVKATFSSTAVADTSNPKTGDEFNMVLWSGMAMTSLLCIAAMILGKKKYR